MDSRRLALIVANDEYEHSGLQRLFAPAEDARALGAVLADPEIGGFTVEVVYNESAHVVQGKIEDLFVECRSNDVLLLHFSCHGLKSESGDLFFAARNTKPNRLGSTAVPADFVQRCMRTSRSRSIVLLLDCCYGGAFSQGVTVRGTSNVNVLDSFPTGRQGGGRGRAVITASSAMEYAFEDESLTDGHGRQRPSLFTAALVEGLATGEADRDDDGLISLNELYDYVFDKVREQNPNQTPSRNVDMQGELYLARSRRLRPSPLSIPQDLEAALSDRNMFTRIGAVSELRTRLTGNDLSAAAGAYDALAKTARADIHPVADPAKSALSDAVVQPAESSVNFGRVHRGSPTLHRLVQLRGPAIARYCVASTSDTWITATVTADGVDVSADASQPGAKEGQVTLRGYASTAAITVAVEIAEPEAEPEPVDQIPATTASAGAHAASPVETSDADPEAPAGPTRPEHATVAGPAWRHDPSPVAPESTRRRHIRWIFRAALLVAAIAVTLLGFAVVVGEFACHDGDSTAAAAVLCGEQLASERSPVLRAAVILGVVVIALAFAERRWGRAARRRGRR
jgi:hypothetical protein